MTSTSSPYHISHSVTIWGSVGYREIWVVFCLCMSRDELTHNGEKLAPLPIRGIQWVWCANTIVSITSLTVSSCPDVFIGPRPQWSWAKYNQCKIASEQNHLTVFRLITGEAWMYWPGSMFQSTASWPPCLTLCLMSRRTSEVITQQSWENELAWNEGAVPSQSPELARQWPPLPLAVIIWRLISGHFLTSLRPTRDIHSCFLWWTFLKQRQRETMVRAAGVCGYVISASEFHRPWCSVVRVIFNALSKCWFGRRWL